MKVEVQHEYTITLTPKEAAILCAIVGNTGGYSPEFPEIRKFTDDLFTGLHRDVGEGEYYENIASRVSGHVKE